MLKTRRRFSKGAAGGTVTARRLVGALPDLPSANHERAHARGGTGWRGNGLWINQGRSGEIGPALGKTSRDSSCCAAVFVHLWTPTIYLQSLHRRDRDFLHPLA